MSDLTTGRFSAALTGVEQPLSGVENDRPVANRETARETTCSRCGKNHVLPCDPAVQRDPLWVDNAIALYGINEARRARAKELSGG